MINVKLLTTPARYISLACVLLLSVIASFSQPAHALGAPVAQVLQVMPQRNCRDDAVYGFIGEKWRRMGGPNSPMGCPLDDREIPLPEGGTIRRFWNGTMAWTPRNGPQLITVAYQAGNNIYVAWGDSTPFNYDFHIVSWNINGVHDDQDDVVTQRTGGWFVLRNVPIGRTIDFRIAGCDEVGLRGQKARCRQGWSNPVSVFTVTNPIEPDRGVPSPPLRGHWYDIDNLIDLVQKLPWREISAVIAGL